MKHTLAALTTFAIHLGAAAVLWQLAWPLTAPPEPASALAVRLLPSVPTPPAQPRVRQHGVPHPTPPLIAAPRLPSFEIAVAAPGPAITVLPAAPPETASPPGDASNMAARTTEPARLPSRPAQRGDCPAATYPAVLRDRGMEGLAQVRVHIDAEGRPLRVALAAGSGWRLLDEAALTQARACRYLAALHEGRAVASEVEFPVRFALR